MHPTYCKYNHRTKDCMTHYVHVTTRPDFVMLYSLLISSFADCAEICSMTLGL